MDYYSIKMRASASSFDEHLSPLENHISGAERIVKKESIKSVCEALIERALHHSKGEPDKINIKIEKIEEENIKILEALPVQRIDVDNAEEGLKKAFQILFPYIKGTSLESNFQEKIQELLKQTYPMRGAMLYDIFSGTRLEEDKNRGIRATYMDFFHSHISSEKNHFNEALVLATKVAHAPGIVGEICISDDPDYVTGYVASKSLGYIRIMKMKQYGDPNGGRIFLFDSRKANPLDCIHFLQKEKTLVSII